MLDHVFTDAISALRDAFESAFLERQPFEEHFQADVLLGDLAGAVRAGRDREQHLELTRMILRQHAVDGGEERIQQGPGIFRPELGGLGEQCPSVAAEILAEQNRSSAAALAQRVGQPPLALAQRFVA